MKKCTYCLLVLWLLIGHSLAAQNFFFSAEKPASCSSSDGIITIVPTRGVPPFSYQWSTGANTVSLNGISKGTYTATLTDASGATVSQTYYLNSEELDINLTGSTPSTFCTLNSGSLTVEAVDGAAPFTYTWSNGQTGPSCTGLSIGTYTVTVQDATGCVAIADYTNHYINAGYSPYTTIQVVDAPDCLNTTAGALKANLNYSGYTPYTYQWNNGATTETINNLGAGTYTVTITDALGCSSSIAIELLHKMDTTGSVICQSANIGTASALLVNATAPVTYNWSNGQSGPSLTNLPGGSYYVTATDAQGCTSVALALVVHPEVYCYNASPACYSGNNGSAYCWMNNDVAVSYLWDNGDSQSNATGLAPGVHTVTVTTSLGCTVSQTVNIPAPIAPAFQITGVSTPANCAISSGGTLTLNITGGITPYNGYVYGPNGSFTNNFSNLTNLVSGDYYVAVYNNNNGCSGYANFTVADLAGFEPELAVTDVDCNSGTFSAAVTGVSTPGVQYQWSNGVTTPDLYNLAPGCYQVTVSGVGTCLAQFEFCNITDSINTNCYGLVAGDLLNDGATAGCSGTQGIPYQLVTTLPSGALNFTDENGHFEFGVPNSTISITPASYDLSDFACPAGGVYTVTSAPGQLTAGLDFHFYNPNQSDRRVVQSPLRTAQPGYPYSIRYKVCNDGGAAAPATLDLTYDAMFGSVAGNSFSQHPGAFVFVSENAGFPNTETHFTLTTLNPGACELLQADLLTPTTATLGQQYESTAFAGSVTGDATPDNNLSSRFGTVTGAFDPNGVYAYPVRTGNPHEGGDIMQAVDKTVTYQIFFQNTGNAPADYVTVRDTLDANLDINSIRNISATHNMKVAIEGQNNILVFRFPNINLIDSTTDYASSIGSIQYDIDLKPGVQIGANIKKQAAIYFDFNAPVATNENVLTVTLGTGTHVASGKQNQVRVFPNPADAYVGFVTDHACNLKVFNSVGILVTAQSLTAGLQRLDTHSWDAGIYFLEIEDGKNTSFAKVVISR